MKNNKFLTKAKLFLSKIRRLNNNDLKKVSGAGEPEEFDWKPKGYVTPVKEEPKGENWAFSPINNKDKNTH